MLQVMFLICVMLAGLAVISVFVRWYTAFCYRVLVTGKSDAVDYILKTREVPAAWRRLKLENLARKLPGKSGMIAQRALIRHYARKARRLSGFVRGNRRISPDETRMAAREIQAIADEWAQCEKIDELM